MTPPDPAAGSTPPIPQEVISEAEARFERVRKSVGLFLGPGIGLLIYLLPLGLEPQAHRLSAILAWVVIYWVTEAIPIAVTALMGPVLCILTGVGPAKDVLAAFANPVIFLFIGSFLIAQAMIVHGLDRRMALGILSTKAIGSSPARLLFGFGAISAFLSMWISNTAATAMVFPIAVGIVLAIRRVPGNEGPELARYATGLMLMVAYAASVGGIATIIGTPPNLIGVGLIEKLAGVKIGFFQWMTFALPVTIIMFVGLFGLLYRLHAPGKLDLAAARRYLADQQKKLGGISAGERNALIAFLTAVSLWVVPGVIAIVLGADHGLSKWLDTHLPEAVVALIASLLLFVLPVDWAARRFTLSWDEAVQIDWGTILLFGGGLSLGGLMFQTGLAEVMGRGIVAVFQLESLWGLTAIAIASGIIVSELTSNTASANMVIPVMMAIAGTLGVNPIAPALGACLGASYGFMLPISTPPNAIVYGSGMIPILKMVRAGILFDLLGFALIWLGLRTLLPLVGLV